MTEQARVVVIGGGAVGVATLYHLVEKGWRDCILLERKELTSGSTWHAAGLLPLFNLSYSVGQIHKYSVALYSRLQAAGTDIGLRRVGNIRLATTADRMDEYRHYAGVAATIGVEVAFLTPDEVREIWPLCATDGLLGAIRHPQDGYVQPADLTQALAAAARAGGAQIRRHTVVTGIDPGPGGRDWIVRTATGEIACEHVVACTGSFARATGAMVGLDVPVMPVEHQYIVTEAHPEILARRKAGLPEMGVLRESDGSWYMREEAGGLLLGPYEAGAPACYVDGPDPESEYELFQEDLDRLAPHIESAIRRVPAFGEAGVKRVYNGAIAYTPDGSPLVGPAPGLRNFWLNEGHSFGITAAGGAGWQLAEWIVEGEPGIDMLGVDPRRFGPYARGDWLRRKAEEAYANVFTVHYPDEERAAARPLRTAPCHGRMQALGAVFGQKYGWERPNWFPPPGTGMEAVDHWSFRRSRWFDAVGAECRNVARNVGILDMTPFAKCRLSGPGAEAFLDRLLANRLPRKAGRIALCHALSPGGGVHSEFTVQREGADSFYLVSAAGFTGLDHDWLWRHLPGDGSVRFDDLTAATGVLVVAGPKARALLSRLTRADLSNAAFPWLSGREIDLAMVPVKALRVNFVGELGWELHHPIEMQNTLFDALAEDGADLGLKPFGIRAMDALRLEKSYRMVGAELSIEYAALESGLDRFVRLDKGDFIGREALLAWRERGFRNAFATLEVGEIADADALANAPVFAEGRLAGRTTAGGYGFRLERSLALAMVDPALAAPGTALEVDILGRRHPALVVPESPYDPGNARLRA